MLLQLSTEFYFRYFTDIGHCNIMFDLILFRHCLINWYRFLWPVDNTAIWEYDWLRVYCILAGWGHGQELPLTHHMQVITIKLIITSQYLSLVRTGQLLTYLWPTFQFQDEALEFQESQYNYPFCDSFIHITHSTALCTVVR